MKSVRGKLLALLLLVALVPLVSLGVLDQWMIRNLGENLASDLRKYLIEDAKNDLRQIVTAYGRLVEVEARLYESLIMLQAFEAEKALAATVAGEAPIFLDTDFDADPSRIPGLTASDRHRTAGADGRIVPGQVSFEVPVYRLASDADGVGLRDDMRRLGKMVDFFEMATARSHNQILWQYVTLEEGVHMAYPGKGDYPTDYEPRERRWYVRARQVADAANPADRMVWVAPIVDAATGQVLMTVAKAIHAPDGSFRGVTALDVPMTDMLSETRLPAAWAGHASIEMISLIPAAQVDAEDQHYGIGTDQGTVVPIVVASADAHAGERDWRAQINAPALQVSDREAMVRLVQDLRARQPRVRVVEQAGQAGQAMVWASAPIGPHAALLIRIPEAVVTARADQVRDEALAQMWRMARASGVLLLTVILLLLLLVLRVSAVVTRPVHAMADAARALADGDFKVSVANGRAYRAGREFGQMAEAFNAMVPQLQDRLKMQDSLHLAMQVQQSLLPQEPPAVVGLDIAGQSLYCDETGGDYFDYFTSEAHPRRVGLMIGDVVGHGIAAALLMASVRAMLHSEEPASGALAAYFAKVNRQLCASRFVGRFMTAYLLLVDREHGQLHWISAGHDPAMVYFPDRDVFEALAGSDIPLGVEESWDFHEASQPLWREPAVVVIGTDGIWEARNVAGEMFGKPRLEQVIREHAAGDAGAMVDAIVQAVQRFCTQVEQQDDITLIVARVDPQA